MPFHLYHLFAFVNFPPWFVLLTRPPCAEFGPKKWSGRSARGRRKVHNQPMVRLGGVSIFLGTLISLTTGLGDGRFFIDGTGSASGLPPRSFKFGGV